MLWQMLYLTMTTTTSRVCFPMSTIVMAMRAVCLSVPIQKVSHFLNLFFGISVATVTMQELFASVSYMYIYIYIYTHVHNCQLSSD